MFKKNIISLSLLFLCLTSYGQDGNRVFEFLKLPFSSHATALGGENISIIEDDLTMAIQNPALLPCVSDKTLNLNYMYYMDGVNVASAAFSRLLRTRSSWAVTAQYLDYGSMAGKTEGDEDLGEFSAKDMAISGIYAYELSDYWSGGVRTNMIYSSYESYSSFAVGVDLGVNYFNPDTDLSFSVVAKNLGGQIVAFDEQHEKLPFDLQAGFTKGLAHAPVRFSVTFYNLTNWKDSYSPDGKKQSAAKKIMNHIAAGVDFIPTNNLYLALGYNFRKANEMKIGDSSHWAGLTAGAGIYIKKIKLGVAYSKQHLSTSALLLNLSLTL